MIEGECVVYVFNMSAAIESRLRCLCVLACFSIKALCHATCIRADCLLIIEAAHAHTVNEQWAWWMVDKFTYTFKPAI